MRGVGVLAGEPRYRWFVAARVVSVFGNALAPVALAFAVLEGGLGRGFREQTTSLGWLLLARMAAQSLFFLSGGVVADRLSRRHTMIVADLTAATSQALLGILFLTGHTALPVLLALTFVSGAASAMFMPASEGLLPLLLPKESLQDGQAVLQIGTSSAQILGAASAGLLVEWVGAGAALVVDAGTFLVSAACLTAMPLQRIVRTARASIVGDLRHGWSEFSGRPWVWATVVQMAFLNICLAGGIYVLGPVVARDHLGGPVAWSVLVAAQAVGFLLGSAAALQLHPRRGVLVAVLLTLGFAPALLLLALPAPLWLVAAAMLVEGMCVQAYGVFWMSVFYTRVPEEVMSRVNSYEQVAAMALTPIGFALAGPLAARFGTRETLLAFGFLMLCTVGAALASRSVRTITVLREESADRAGDPVGGATA